MPHSCSPVDAEPCSRGDAKRKSSRLTNKIVDYDEDPIIEPEGENVNGRKQKLSSKRRVSNDRTGKLDAQTSASDSISSEPESKSLLAYFSVNSKRGKLVLSAVNRTNEKAKETGSGVNITPVDCTDDKNAVVPTESVVDSLKNRSSKSRNPNKSTRKESVSPTVRRLDVSDDTFPRPVSDAVEGIDAVVVSGKHETIHDDVKAHICDLKVLPSNSLCTSSLSGVMSSHAEAGSVVAESVLIMSNDEANGDVSDQTANMLPGAVHEEVHGPQKRSRSSSRSRSLSQSKNPKSNLQSDKPNENEKSAAKKLKRSSTKLPASENHGTVNGSAVETKSSISKVEMTEVDGADAADVNGSDVASDNSMSAHRGRLSLKGRKVDNLAPLFRISLANKRASSSGKSLSETDATQPKLTAAAPALVNLGNTCFMNSVVQILYYTPAFVDCIAVLVNEMHATDRDNDVLANIKDCKVPLLSVNSPWKFVERIHELMKKVDGRFACGCSNIEAICPSTVYNQLEQMNETFSGGHQQDAHELLRCVLSYVQDAIKLLDAHRALLHEATACNVKHAVSDLNAENKQTISNMSSDKQMANDSDVHSKSVKDAKVEPQKPGSRRSKGPDAGKFPVEAIAKSFSKSGSITNFFAAMPTKPKSLSEVSPKVTPVVDIVSKMFEGMVKRQTRCLECEEITTCEESFQDVEVVVHKNSSSSSAVNVGSDQEDSLDAADAGKCWIVKSLQEVELLQTDNKYWCCNCFHYTEAERTVEYHRLPEILTIQLKRFAAFSTGHVGGFTKTMNCVDVPFTMDCFEKQCQKCPADSKHSFELFAILCHTGVSLSSGHYVAYVRAPVNHARIIETVQTTTSSVDNVTASDTDSNCNRRVIVADPSSGPWWYICDDQAVAALTQADLQSKLSEGGATTPYLLFYRQRVIVTDTIVVI